MNSYLCTMTRASACGGGLKKKEKKKAKTRRESLAGSAVWCVGSVTPDKGSVKESWYHGVPVKCLQSWGGEVRGRRDGRGEAEPWGWRRQTTGERGRGEFVIEKVRLRERTRAARRHWESSGAAEHFWKEASRVYRTALMLPFNFYFSRGSELDNRW